MERTWRRLLKNRSKPVVPASAIRSGAHDPAQQSWTELIV
jgi:hypothetical protein